MGNEPAPYAFLWIPVQAVCWIKSYAVFFADRILLIIKTHVSPVSAVPAVFSAPRFQRRAAGKARYAGNGNLVYFFLLYEQG